MSVVFPSPLCLGVTVLRLRNCDVISPGEMVLRTGMVSRDDLLQVRKRVSSPSLEVTPLSVPADGECWLGPDPRLVGGPGRIMGLKYYEENISENWRKPWRAS